jgi:uncharacterized protein (TIGR02001 family)
MLTRVGVLVTGLLLGAMAPAVAADEEKSNLPGTFTGNVAITNDYVFRGYTQNMEDAAIQGGLDWDSGVGFYLGTWGSNAHFGVPGEGSIEWDVYGGYRGAIEKFTYDVGALGYIYPGAAKALNYNWWEAHVVVGYDFGVVQTSAGLYYTPDYFGGNGNGVYYTGKILVPIAEGLSIDGTIGRTDVKGTALDYTDYSIGITYAFKWFTTDVRFYDTDVKACKDVCDSRVVVKFSRAF